MEQKNLKVILELKDNLNEKQKQEAIEYIEKWKNKFDIEKVDSITYCKKGNNLKYEDDFGSVTFFYGLLIRKKEYLKKLELIKIQSGKRYVTV